MRALLLPERKEGGRGWMGRRRKEGKEREVTKEYKVCWHALKRGRYVELFFSRVCTESNFGLFTFDCLRHLSTAYRVLHTRPKHSFIVQYLPLVPYMA